MFFKEKVKKVFKRALTSDFSAQKLALSFSMGLYIAFSPFPGAHTVIMLATKWLFNLNLPILFIISSINNPWTMIPFFMGDYVFGYWVTHNVLNWHPNFVISLAKIFGSGEICLYSFLIGGNILGILAALISYPIMNFIFKKLIKKHNEKIY